MDKQPHVRVPNECFPDQPPLPGEAGYDSEYTPMELKRYIRQQRVLEKAVAANEKFNLQREMTMVILISLIVRMIAHFIHRNHLCIVFELLSHNLYQVIKKSKSLSLPLVRKFAYQLLNSLHFLYNEVHIIHSDLKPENILLREPNMIGIKIIDFGSSCRYNDKIFNYIQSRFYRAPEVLLGMDYSHPIDMWSLGCILVELHTGVPLFPGQDSYDQVSFFFYFTFIFLFIYSFFYLKIKRIIEYTGIPSASMLDKCTKKDFFLCVDEYGCYNLLPELVCIFFFSNNFANNYFLY